MFRVTIREDGRGDYDVESSATDYQLIPMIKQYFLDDKGLTLEQYINKRGYSFRECSKSPILNLDVLEIQAITEYRDECKELGIDPKLPI